MHAPSHFARAATAAAAAALTLSAPAAAQPRQYGFAEIAADLAYGFCPLFLANQFALDAPQLAERGFAKTVHKQPSPRFGELQLVSVTRAEGEIGFGGVPGQVCTVIVMGSGRADALAHLRKTMPYMGLPFAPAPVPDPKTEGVTVEAFKAPVENQFLNVQLIEAAAPTPMVMAQMFATNE
jgi:hypothetical protein